MTALPMLEHGELVYVGFLDHKGRIHADQRKALGTPRQPNWPDSLCIDCFDRTGALIQATGYDTTGNPCCEVCAGNANRRLS